MSGVQLKAQGFDFVVEPTRGWATPNLQVLWDYRELMFFLAWRDVKVRYKQSLLGIGWVVIQPLTAMVVFTVIFGQFAKLPSEGVPYAVFTYAALLPWQLFSSAVTRSASSVLSSSSIFTKVYFPRLVLPVAAIFANVVDFGISLVVFFGLLAIFGIWPGWPLLFLPLFVLLTIATTLAFGIWLAALNVRYRDVTYVVPYLVQLSLFLSPVAYSATLVPHGVWRVIYSLNPLAGLIQGFRWSLIRGPAPDSMLLLSVITVSILLVTGIYYFRRVEKTFADVV
ncbi:MAG TPA: phosphate ABC transporter permease [Chloroflexi bacterium]|jgi:lipopolysaccharide transport system permease protein|nr:phosphate ABC transporter permease [Chloroflexota bacterium]